MRRLAAERFQVVRHRTRITNKMHAILHAHRIPRCPHADLFSGVGRDWLLLQPVPEDDLAVIDKKIATDALDDTAIARLLTITGVNLMVGVGIVAAIGDVSRFFSLQSW